MIPRRVGVQFHNPSVRKYLDGTQNAAAYTHLGTANYVKHEGSRPMSITWELDEPIPAQFLRKTSKLVVG